MGHSKRETNNEAVRRPKKEVKWEDNTLSAAEKKAEADAKKRIEKAKQIKQEQDRIETIKREEERRDEQIKDAWKEVGGLRVEFRKKKHQNRVAVNRAEDKMRFAERERDKCYRKYREKLKEAKNVDRNALLEVQKKVSVSDRAVEYLKKDNEKNRHTALVMDVEIEVLEESNMRLLDANASNYASLDSIHKQKASLEDHNEKLEHVIGQYNIQNKSLERELDSRQAYSEAEARMRDDFENAIEKIIEMMENRCDDDLLVEKIMTAQLQCTTRNLKRLSANSLNGCESLAGGRSIGTG